MANKKKEDFSVKEIHPSIRAKKPLNGPTSSFDLVEEMLYLYVAIEGARLPAPVHSLLQVELKIGNYRGNTSYAARSSKGEFMWSRKFAFTKSKLQDTTVHVLLKGVDGIVISKRSFAVSEALMRVPPDPPLAAQWYKLVDPKGDNSVGELMMAFWTGTQADHAYHDASHSDIEAPLSPEGLLSIRPKVHNWSMFWYLRVHVIAAQDLMIHDFNNREQPAQIFVRADVLECALTTKTCLTKTRNAKWDEDLMFVVADPDDVTLFVGVFQLLRRDASLSTDQGQEMKCIGRCEIPVKNVGKRNDRSPAAIQWKDLKLMEGQGTNERFSSKINMRISLDGGYHVIDEPTEFSSDQRPSAKILWKPTLGVFELGIMSASGLSPLNPKTTVDTFCVAKYGTKWVKTKTIIDNCSPKWNEQCSWDVYDHCTFITIAVFENKYLHKGGERLPDFAIGKVRIRLSDLELNKVYTNSHPLVKLEPYGVKKTGELQLSYRFSPVSVFHVYGNYSRPLWPKLHYELPLSVRQISKLKDQAVKLTVSKMQKAEPPLSEEVVHYVLEDNKYQYSLRRARANFQRCAKLMESFLFCKQWFDRLRNWTNTVHNCIFITCLIVVYFYPSLALSSMFFMLCGLGAWGYRKRPRQLGHIDTELSQVYSVEPDEIAEELKLLPTGVPAEVVMMRRYNRLTSNVLDFQTLFGDIATTGEKVQSLLSWRDRRATLLVLIFFFTAGVFFYFNPCGVELIVIVTILHVIRPPMFRIGLPSCFENFIRRMPSKMDSML
ncbi:FT-interacting protein 3-like [Argentina anserina]|uniref:FT-interacting protein 3-like n=1 Tax=Argentina anserina TaxID=57926 RepID=UPI002176317F|nr:FT-interacting protein 3-like [Potentilla anserina]